MSTVTPNIGIYIPAAGETNYDQAFASGMVNIDQHDHSGGPNKGLPIATEGLGAFSVTFDKLNVNVVNPLTGISTDPILKNQLVLLDPLKSIYTLGAASSVGFLTLNGTIPAVRTFQNSSTITWTNANGIGNPQASVNIAGISPVPVANGGTGLTALSTYDILCGGTSPTGPIQQVSGEGTVNQYLGSNGINMLPSWKTLPNPFIPPQTLFQATVTMSASQFTNLVSTPVQIVPPQGPGTVIIPVSGLGKLNYGGTAFSNTPTPVFCYTNKNFQTPLYFRSGTFDDNFSAYYQTSIQDVTSAGIALVNIENIGLFFSVTSIGNFANGAGSTVTITVFYNVVTI